MNNRHPEKLSIRSHILVKRRWWHQETFCELGEQVQLFKQDRICISSVDNETRHKY